MQFRKPLKRFPEIQTGSVIPKLKLGENESLSFRTVTQERC